jgi:SAM-dependent methyltransferase
MEPKPAQWGPEHAGTFAEPGVAEAYRHRPMYPPATFTILCDLLAPGVPARVLDAGCGTGFVARPLAPLVEQVDAVDIAPAMVAEGRRSPGGDHPRIRWFASPIESFAGEPPYALVAAGASLHWMDWEVALPRFASWLAAGGMLALVGDLTEGVAWGTEIGPLIARYSLNRDFRPYTTRTIVEELERRGLFRLLGARTTAYSPFQQRIESYIEAFHARNGLARARMGPAAEALDRELRAVLQRHCPDGVVRLQVAAEVLWGRPIGGLEG